MNFREAVAELEGRRESRMVPDLSRILSLATLLSDPQLTYPSIHVTGTNGKGTAARVAAELACAHGLTTGLYTSPHLVSVRERLSVCGVDITEEEFAEEYEHLLPYLMLVDSQGEEQVTYFEALSALAYLWFADKPVALGVFEVGMGGHVGRDEPGARRRRRPDPDRARPSGAGLHDRGGGGREGGHHQGGHRRGEPRAGRRCPAR